MYIRNRLGMTESTETLMAHEQRMNQISNNLANVDTSGYKKEHITFWEMMFTAADRNPRVGKALKVVTDHQQGGIETTGNSLDFSINGEGFFRVQTPDGVRYTRNGNFALNGEGQLSTLDGHIVLGEGGAIALESEDVQVGRDGLISVNGEIVNQLSLVTFDDLSDLEKEGNTLYKLQDENAQELPVLSPNIQQRTLEGANVSVVTEMTEMIDLHRAFQTQQKAIQTIDDIDQLAISRVGKLT